MAGLEDLCVGGKDFGQPASTICGIEQLWSRVIQASPLCSSVTIAVTRLDSPTALSS